MYHEAYQIKTYADLEKALKAIDDKFIYLNATSIEFLALVLLREKLQEYQFRKKLLSVDQVDKFEELVKKLYGPKASAYADEYFEIHITNGIFDGKEVEDRRIAHSWQDAYTEMIEFLYHIKR